MGYVNYLVASDELEQATRDPVRPDHPHAAMVQWIRKCIMRAALDSTLETTMTLTSNAGGILCGSEDVREARQAYLEKRTLEFKGR